MFTANCRRNSGGCDTARWDAPCVWFPKNKWVRQINIPANNCLGIRVPPANVRANFGDDGGGEWDRHGGANGHCICTGNQVATASVPGAAGVPPSCHWLQHLLVLSPFVCPCLCPAHYSLHVLVPNRQVDGENGNPFFMTLSILILCIINIYFLVIFGVIWALYIYNSVFLLININY